jgi:hypothetical protein
VTKTMSEGRGLLTETEREAIAGELSDSYRYKTRSYLGRRIEKLETDIEVLTEHAPELLDDLEAAVCTGRDQAGEVHGVGDTQPLQEARGSRQTPPTVNDDRPVEDTGTEAGAGVDSDETPAHTLADVDFPSGKNLDACGDAVHAARRLLKEQGAASMREIVAAVHPDHPLGYDVDAALAKVEAGERYRGAWWRRIVKPGLETFDDVEVALLEPPVRLLVEVDANVALTEISALSHPWLTVAVYCATSSRSNSSRR